MASIHVELQTKIAITTSLENAAQSERPGNVFTTQKEVAHLHGVASQPINDNRQSETLA